MSTQRPLPDKFSRSCNYALSLAAVLLATPFAQATSSSWGADASGSWATAGDWSGSVIPGATSGTTNADTATFDPTLTSGRTVTVDANRNIGNISFSNTSAFGYTLSGGNLLLSTAGVIQTTSGNGNHTDTISTAIALQGTGTGTSATFTAGATSATSVLNIGAVTGTAVTGTRTLILNGTNTGNNAVTGIIGDGSAGGKVLVNKAGAGLWTLSGANTYTGGTTLDTGTLQIGVASVGSVGAITSSALGTGTLLINGGTISSDSTTARTILNAVSLAGSVILGNATNTGTLTFGANIGLGNAQRTVTINSAVQFDGVLSGTTGGGLLKAGASTLTLTGTSTYTGVTSITGGTLSVATIGNGSVAGNLGQASNAAANIVISGSGATLQYTGATASTDRNFTLGSNSGAIDASGTGALTLATTSALAFSSTVAHTLTLTGTNTSDNTYAGILADNTGLTALTKSGIGKWVLAGTNTYTGVTSVTGGTLSVATIGNGGVAGNLGQASNLASNLSINGGTLQYTGATASTDRNFAIGIGGGTFDASGTGALTLSGTATLSGSNTARTLTLTGTNTGANTYGTILANNGTGATSLAKSGVGTWVLSAGNTYTGTTTVNAGTLTLGAADRIANSSNLIMAGGTFSTGGFSETLGTLTLSATSTIDLGSSTSALVFADSSATSWGTSISLSFVNFTAGTDTICIGTTSGGLSPAQLAQITINGSAATINGTGFLAIAIPEPSTYAMLASGLALAGTIVYRRRRHA